MRNTALIAGLAGLTMIASTAPAFADYYRPAPHRYVRHTNYRHACIRHKANNGTAIGAVTGGLLGSALGHGTGSVLLGAGAGAVAGHQIAKNNARSSC